MHATQTPQPRRLRVGIIVGVDRAAGNLERAATAFGCDLELHTGQTAGRGAPSLAAMIARVDLVVILTDVNSHNAVVAARKLASAHGRRAVLMLSALLGEVLAA